MPDRELGPQEDRRPDAAVADRDDVEIIFADPASQGAVAASSRGAAPDAGRDPRGPVAPGAAPMHGRMMRPGEAREMSVEVMGSLGEAFGRFVEGLGEVEDVIDDEQALALARRSMAGRAKALAHVPGVDRLAIEATREPGLPMVPGAAPRDVPPPPANLPALINMTPAYKDPNWVDGQALPPIRWEQIYGTPGYLQQMIRAFGRELFRTFPCFAEHERMAAQAGRDALGELHVLANLGGSGPSHQIDLDQAATWVRANGVPIDAATFNFPHMEGYNPSVVLAADADRSYLLVNERRDMGAPVDSMYVYSWPGGMGFYHDKLPAQDRVARRVGVQRMVEPPRRAVAGGRNARPQLPPGMGAGAAQGGRLRVPPMIDVQQVERAPPRQPRDDGRGRVALDAMMEVPALPDAARARRECDARRPVAAAQVTTSTLTEALVGLGFKRGGSPEGPVLRLRSEDGMEAIARGVEPNVPLHLATTMRLVVRDETGGIVVDDVVASRDDVEAALAGPSPRP